MVKYKLGIRREEFNKWERRCALPPKYCKKLLLQMGDELVIKVQTSMSRYFTDSEFRESGCEVCEDITDCDLIIGVKQVPVAELYPQKTYMFFSHVIKAQHENMPMLDSILEKKIRLIDYEKITDKQGRRLVAFGKFAGNSGAVDIFSGLGTFLLNRGIGTPFLNISQSYNYPFLDKAKSHIKDVGYQIKIVTFCDQLVPFIVGVTGGGRCAQGALEIVECFPHEFITPEELEVVYEQAKQNPEKHNKLVYIVQFSHQHMVRRKDATEDYQFDKADYYENPEEYEGIFQQKYLKYLSVMINCIYWEDKYPRLVTKKYLKDLYSKGENIRLLAISDVTCDFKGSVDFLEKFTTIDHPFFVFDPATSEISDDYKKAPNGILYDSIENMPTQFPKDASDSFGKNLYPFMQEILKSKFDGNLKDQGLSPEMQKAVITCNGKLTERFTYINKLRKEKEKFTKLKEKNSYRNELSSEVTNLILNGHLFDTHAINEILDILFDKHNCYGKLTDTIIGEGEEYPSKCSISVKKVEGYSELDDTIMDHIKEVCQKHDIQLKITKASEQFIQY